MSEFLERAAATGLRSCGRQLASSPEAFGELRETDPAAAPSQLRAAMDRDGYLFFRGFLNPEKVAQGRLEILNSLAKDDALDPSAPLEDGVAKQDYTSDFQSEDQRFPSVREVVGAETIKSFFDRFLEGESRSLDHVWLRIKSPGRSTAPHCDIVYMGRGTKDLYTIWVPLGDIPLDLGPLMILEKSHRSPRIHKYCQMDIDADGNAKTWRFRHWGFFKGAQYTKKPGAAQREIGGRWLSTDFRAGDLIVFSTSILHGSLDNRTDRIRISADARYQLAAEPADPRWAKAPGDS